MINKSLNQTTNDKDNSNQKQQYKNNNNNNDQHIENEDTLLNSNQKV
jgi:hypothetical protein